MRWTWSRIDVLLSLKCACCLLFSPASPARTSLQPQWYLQAIHLTGADHYAVDRQLYAGGRWDCLYYNYRLLLFSFFNVSFSWASIMLKPLTVMVEPLSLLDSARSAQSCSFNKIHPGKEWLSRAPDLCSTPKPLKTNKKPTAAVFGAIWFLIILRNSCRQRLSARAVENMASLMSYEETASSICVGFSGRMWRTVVVDTVKIVFLGYAPWDRSGEKAKNHH